MSDQYLGEIRIFGGNFAPQGWALCNGQILPISQNAALFSLLGTNYGGDGMTTFALPNFQGRVPVGQGQGPELSLYDVGESTGKETVTLNQQQVPSHLHTLTQASYLAPAVTTAATTNLPGPSLAYAPAADIHGQGVNAYIPVASATPGNKSLLPTATLASGATTDATGGSLPHNNLQPYLVLNFIIALVGIYPPRS